MALQNSEAHAVNYVIVEAVCRFCGKALLKLSHEAWAGRKSCPHCHQGCAFQFLGHGFSSDSTDQILLNDSAAVRPQPIC